MNCCQVCGTSWKPCGIWQCRLHARQKLLSICLECFDLFVNQTQGKIHSQKVTPKSFSVIDFFFNLQRLVCSVMVEFFTGKCCLCSVFVLHSAQFAYWKRSFICDVCYQIVWAVPLPVTICLFVDAHF